jgi:hypothetical protein
VAEVKSITADNEEQQLRLGSAKYSATGNAYRHSGMTAS